MATFLPGPDATAGQQVLFHRVRILVDNLVPGQTYTITHPYGVDTIVAQQSFINSSSDVGCLAAPCGTFQSALTGRIGPWLTWDPTVAPAAPTGFIGDFAIPHKVTGSPLGTNFFRIVGPNVGGPGINTIQTDLFNIQGRNVGPRAPIIAASVPGGFYNAAQSVTLKADDPTATVFFTTDGTEPTTTSPQFKAGDPPIVIPAPAVPSTRTTTLKFVSVNAAGVKSPTRTEVYSIDTAPPTAAIALSSVLPPAKAGLYRSAVVATITGADDAAPNGSGVKSLEYSLDAGPTPANWVTIQRGGTVPVDFDGSHGLVVRVTDAAGNVTITPASTFTIDTTPPIPSIALAGAQGTGPNFRGAVTATISGVDRGSGLSTLEFSLDGSPTASIASNGTVTIGTDAAHSTDGAHVIHVRATDAAGNVATQASSFVIDTVPPVVSLSPAGGTYGAPQTVTLAVNEPGAALYYTLDGSEPTQASIAFRGPFAISGPATLRVLALDLAGNTSQRSEVYQVILPVVGPPPVPTPAPTPVPAPTPPPPPAPAPAPGGGGQGGGGGGGAPAPAPAAPTPAPGATKQPTPVVIQPVPAPAPVPAPGPAPEPVPSRVPVPDAMLLGPGDGPVDLVLPGGRIVVVSVDTAALAELPADSRLRLEYEPAPVPPSDAAAGILGGGNVDPVGGPIRLRMTLFGPGAPPAPVLPEALARASVELRLPVLAQPEQPSVEFAWLMEIQDSDGQFLGYDRLAAEYDPATDALISRVELRDLRGTLLLPALILPAFIRNHDANVHIWSNPRPDAVDFGLAGPQFTLFKVVGPQVSNRIFVYNLATQEYGWIDASGVGNVPAPEAAAPPPEPAEPTAVDTEPAPAAPETVLEEPRADSAEPPAPE
jgi:hypothetical protein